MAREFVQCSRPDLWLWGGDYGWFLVDNADRIIDWSKAGVWYGGVKGIPVFPVSITMQATNPAGQYYIDPSGVVDATASINAALAACATGGAVLLPAGTFRINTTGTYVAVTKSGTALRGAGAGTTKLMGYSQVGYSVYFNGGGLDTSVAINSGYTKGSNTLVLSSIPSGLVVGSYAMITQTNDTSLMGGPTTYMIDAISQIVKVSEINGTTVTLDRNLYYSYNPTYAPKFARMTSYDAVGLEELTVDLTNSLSGGVRFQSITNGWIRKCEITGAGGWLVRLVQSARCEVSRCYSHHGEGFAADQAYGIGLYGRCTDNLIEDNRLYYLRHGIVIEYGNTGNVIAYNYSDINYDENIPNSTLMQSIHTHGGFPYMNLFEGNVTSQMNFDAYLGQPASRWNTLLRNHSRGYDRPGTGRRFCLEVSCHQLYENIIGNVFGRDGDYGIGDYEQLTTDPNDECVYRIGWWGSIYTGYAYDGITPLPDVRVANTIMREGNYDYITNQTRWSAGAKAIPDSLYLSSKPSWFGILDWPAIGPDISGYVKDIPAKSRWDRYLISGELKDMFETGFVIDHAVINTDIDASADVIPAAWIAEAKSKLHIAYGTASHGLQLHYGAVCLKNWDGTGKFDFNMGGSLGQLDWRTWTSYGYFGNLGMALSLDLDANTNGDRTIWEAATRTYLNANPDINVIMWAWCAGLTGASDAQRNLYLSLMEGLEADYPNVKFVYMTAHVNGAANEPTDTHNAYIRAYCIANNKILYDFADIESWDPSGNYFGDHHPTANCDYDGGGNWATEWQAAHQVGTEWFACYSPCMSCHSQDLNCNQKAVAVWHLFARLAGWTGV